MSDRASNQLSRRTFVRQAAAAAGAVSVFPHVLRAAAPDQPIRVGLIGSGERGMRAAINAVSAAPHVSVIALADMQQSKMDNTRKYLKDNGIEVPDAQCFLGMDAYKKVLSVPEVNYVILATPPYYRPEHFAAAIAAGKHVFMEKPVAVDPVGCRSIMASGQQATEKNLMVVAGTQRRHQKSYVETIRRIHDGAIGEIRGGQCYWLGGGLWFMMREYGEADMPWMHRDWVNWAWLSGDHVCEQHVHNLDVINWILKSLPEKAVAVGGRARRRTGNQFDFFSADLTYPGEIHVHSMCRQINDCEVNVSERVIGTKGWSDACNFISGVGELKIESPDPYVQEHADLIAAIRTGKPLNEARQVAESTLTAIMIRTSAYTGKAVTWKEMMESDMKLEAPTVELTPENIRKMIPVPGTEQP